MTFADEFIDLSSKNELIEKYLINNFWYQKANTTKREEILKRVQHVNENLQIVLDFIDKKYGTWHELSAHLNRRFVHLL
ncbi:hypothetical protein H6796_01595 [Candidatus Nomurabacteria bacterium]|nr:hypothetical protein [Candidatus Nomurabacteria bacterium]